jgi:NADPH-dependent curcumin reductase CurA
LEKQNRRIVLASRPVGEPRDFDFRLEHTPIAEPAVGQVLVRTLWLSLDPYMRGRMSDAKSYARSVGIGEVMVGGTVGEVLRSNDPSLSPGDLVVGPGGWQEYFTLDGTALRKLDPHAAPVQTALGVLGMPGWTAYAGLLRIGQPKADETVVVAAASGAVGSVVGQIAKLKGCHVIGIAGGPTKCTYLIDELGFDAAIDHKQPGLDERLRAACPKGIDVYFENVGGAVWDAVFPLLNAFARIPICGMISRYNATDLPPGPDRTPLLLRAILVKRLTVRGYIITDFGPESEAFSTDMAGWLRDGKIKYREDIVEGLENAPRALMGLLKGENFGKLLVHIS